MEFFEHAGRSQSSRSQSVLGVIGVSLLGFAISATLPSVACAGSYVKASVSYSSMAGSNPYDHDANLSDSQDTGNLAAVPSASLSISGAAEGEFYSSYNGVDSVAHPAIGVGASMTVTPGKFQGHVTVFSVTDLGSIVSPTVGGTYNTGSASARATWQDVVTFKSDNANGSDYTFTVGIDATYTDTATFSTRFTNTAFWESGTSTNVTWTGDASGGLSAFNGAADSRPTGLFGPHPYQSNPGGSATLHVSPDHPLTLVFTGSAELGAEVANLDAYINIEATHTIVFAIATDDPLAHYTTESGVTFPTAVPEPASLGLLGLSVFAATARRRRDIASN